MPRIREIKTAFTAAKQSTALFATFKDRQGE